MAKQLKKKKITSHDLTRKQIYEHLDNYIDGNYTEEFDSGVTRVDPLPGCCGMSVISELTMGSRVHQAANIYAAFNGVHPNDHNVDVTDKVGQVLFTDTTVSKAWKEAKHFALAGPITRNPKSINHIQLFIYTRKELDGLVSSFTAADVKELLAYIGEEDDNEC